MLVVLIKAVLVFIIVLFCVRLMGKRQLSEMQPFELVIMLIIADIASIPLSDPSVPFYGGIVPIIALTFLHIFISILSRKSLFVRRIVSGRPILVIDKQGINYKNLKRMNVSMHDLIEAIRSNGNVDINQIEYAIFETNGKICVVEKPEDPANPSPALLPLTLIVDGKWNNKGLDQAKIKKPSIEKQLKKNKIHRIKDILYMDVRQDGTAYVSPKASSYFTLDLKTRGEW